MARKTLARRISKYLPRSIELQNAEKLMDAGDKGAPVHFEGEFAVVDDSVDSLPPQPPTREAVDENAGDIDREPSAEPEPQNDAPTLADAISLVRAGDYDGARDICPAEDRATLDTMIASRENAQHASAREQAQQTRQRGPRTARIIE
jgi:hypothetical protein